MIETSLSDRVAVLRRRLRAATTYDDAMTVLSMADTATLRTVETDYYREPVSLLVLRDSVATAHLAKLGAEQATDTRRVSPELVTAWVYQSLAEWLPGLTDFDARFGGQFTITLAGIDEHTGGQRYTVATPDRRDPREFAVTVDVQLLADAV